MTWSEVKVRAANWTKKPMPSLRTLWKPALYHGDGARPPFFEGWYFKLVDATEAHRYAESGQKRGSVIITLA